MNEPMPATIGSMIEREVRMCDAVRKGWNEVPQNWMHWRSTYAALADTYYREKFSHADQGYALEGLLQFELVWQREHGHKMVDQRWLDEACAHEVRYHAQRGRQFRKPVAALSTCWRALAIERPERITDRATRATEYEKKKSAKRN